MLFLAIRTFDEISLLISALYKTNTIKTMMISSILIFDVYNTLSIVKRRPKIEHKQTNSCFQSKTAKNDV